LADLPPNEALLCGEPSPQMVASVASLGVLQPIILIASESGSYTYQVADGRHRVKAARAAGLIVIPALVYRSATGGVELTVVPNLLRHRNDMALYEALSKLDANLSDVDIAAALHISRSQLKRLRRLDKLTPSLRQAVLEGRVKPNIALGLSKLSNARQNEAVEMLDAGDKVTGSTVVHLAQGQRSQATQTMLAGLPTMEIVPLVDWRLAVKEALEAIVSPEAYSATTIADLAWLLQATLDNDGNEFQRYAAKLEQSRQKAENQGA
jgi:ParB/RepB/Spo0J family partition protein